LSAHISLPYPIARRSKAASSAAMMQVPRTLMAISFIKLDPSTRSEGWKIGAFQKLWFKGVADV
jgi:hypothetical protein